MTLLGKKKTFLLPIIITAQEMWKNNNYKININHKNKNNSLILNNKVLVKVQ